MGTHEKFQPITAEDAWFIGATKSLRFTVYDENDDIVDPSGWELAWYLRKNRSSTGNLLTKTTDDDISFETDKPIVPIFSTDMAGYEAHTYYYQLWRTDAGFEDVIAFGPAELQK